MKNLEDVAAECLKELSNFQVILISLPVAICFNRASLIHSNKVCAKQLTEHIVQLLKAVLVFAPLFNKVIWMISLAICPFHSLFRKAMEIKTPRCLSSKALQS